VTSCLFNQPYLARGKKLSSEALIISRASLRLAGGANRRPPPLLARQVGQGQNIGSADGLGGDRISARRRRRPQVFRGATSNESDLKSRPGPRQTCLLVAEGGT